MIVVSGILKNPTGESVGAKLRITSETSKGSVVKSTISNVSIGKDGQYSFSLVKGIHTIEVKVCDTFELVGSSIVDDSTPTQITLPELLRYTTPLPVPPPEVDDPVWQLLIDATKGIEGTTQKELDQIRDDNTINAHIDSINTLDSIKAGYSQSSDIAKVDDTESSAYRHAYSDANNQKTAKHDVKLTTDVTSIHEDYSTTRTNKGTLTNLFSKTWTTLKSNIRHVLTHTDTHIQEEEHRHVGDDALFDRSHNLDSTGFIDNYTAIVKDKEIERHESIGDTGAYDSVILTDGDSQASHELKINGLPATDIVLRTGDKATSEKLEITPTGSKKTIEVDRLDVGDVLQVDNISKQVTVKGQFLLDKTQYKGDRGDTVFQVEQYSVDGKTDWQDDFFEGAVYRRINRSINGVIDPTAWSRAYQFTGKDGQKGDTIYYEYNYAPLDLSVWHTTMQDGDVWRKERVVKDSIPGEWSNPARIKGNDGKDGLIETIEYQYSADGVTVWHTNFSAGDFYRRERSVVKDSVRDPTPVYGVWSNPVKIVPERGFDYFDGLNQATLYIYKRAKGTVPDTPTADLLYNFTTHGLTGELNGWAQSIPPGAENLYVAVATAVSNSNIDTIASTEWAAGLLSANGADGIDSQIVVPSYWVALSTPPTPTGTAIPPAGWSREAPSQITGKQKVYVTYTYAGTYTSATGSGTWTRPAQWSGENGTDGIAGKMVRGVYKSAATKPRKPEGSAIPPTGWTETVPDLVKDEVIWACYTYADGEVVTTGTSYWTDVGQWSGKDGTDGLSTARVTLYKVSSTQPNLHSNTLTYTYATGDTTLPNNGWRLDIPSDMKPGDTLWITSATVVNLASISSSDVTPSKFSVPVILTTLGADGKEGKAGKNGLDGEIIRGVYASAATKPVKPTGTTIPPTGWAESVPDAVRGAVIWASYSYARNNTTSIGSGYWTDVGRWSGLDGEPGKEGEPGKDGKDGRDGIDGKAGKDGLSFARIDLYRISRSKPALPTNSLTYNFNTGYLTPPNDGWGTLIPTGMQPGDTLWITSTTVISLVSTPTATINANQFTAPVVFTTVSVDGKNGAGFYSVIVLVNPAIPIKNAAVFPDNTKATYDFTQKVGRSPEIDDHLTYKWIHDSDTAKYNLSQKELSKILTDTTALQEKVLTRRFNGTVWVAPEQIIDGDLLVRDTITADRLKVRELSAIAADMGLVTSGTMQTTSDQKGNRAIITSSGDFPLWVGSGDVNVANALMAYHKSDNTLHVKNIQAKGGRFKDVTVSGHIEGSYIESSILSQSVRIEEKGGKTFIPTVRDTKTAPRYLTPARPERRTPHVSPVKTGNNVAYTFRPEYLPADFTRRGTVYGGGIYEGFGRFYSYNPYRKFTLPYINGPYLCSTIGYDLYFRGKLVRRQPMRRVREWCRFVGSPNSRVFYWVADHNVGAIKIHWKFEEFEDWVNAIPEMWLEVREDYRQSNMYNSEIKLVIRSNDVLIARKAGTATYREQTHNQRTSLHAPDNTGNW